MFNIPIGFLTESSGELGNKRNKAAIKKFSRNCNEEKQNFDVLRRRLWTSDPVLLYEQTFSQKIWSERIRHWKPKTNDEIINSQNVIHLDDLDNEDDEDVYEENDDVLDLVYANSEENNDIASNTSI